MGDQRYKYPKTWHLPWSLGVSPDPDEDDRVLESTDPWIGTQVVITEKLDGEGTSMYSDYIHARSIEFAPRFDRDRIKAIHAEIAYNIPENVRICGENMTAVHSIKYTNLRDWFYVFNIWEGTTCLSWAETLEWCALLGTTRASGKALATVPLLYYGEWYGNEMCMELCSRLDPEKNEGLVVRPAGRFLLEDFPRLCGKYVREHHVRTDKHWSEHIEFNEVQE